MTVTLAVGAPEARGRQWIAVDRAIRDAARAVLGCLRSRGDTLTRAQHWTIIPADLCSRSRLFDIARLAGATPQQGLREDEKD